MKPQTALFVFLLLVLSSVLTGIDSLYRAERQAQQDVDHALALTLQQCEPDRIDADTIRVYRSLISMDAVRDTAYLSFVVRNENEERRAQLTANTGLTLYRLWALSDQRASGVLLLVSALWLMLLRFIPLKRAVPLLGVLSYDDRRHLFYAQGRELRFTPMQHQLMELFMAAPDHRLGQQEICDHLWPKKPDASATLYTLIRRLKNILDQATDITIECQRSESYQLITK